MELISLRDIAFIIRRPYSFTGTLLIIHVSGPMSTQLVVSTALARAGPIGAITAFMLWNVQGLIVLIIFCGVGSSDCLVCGSVQCTILILGIWWVCPPRRYLWCLRRFTALVRSWIKGIGERIDQWR